jgi:hypothetical protein
MRNTALARNQSAYKGMTAANESKGSSVPAPTGGWDAISPLSQMPADHAVQLINFFPQPGYVELRRGHIIWCDTGTGLPIESMMGYMGQGVATNNLFAASGGNIFDVTGTTPATAGTGFTSDRWQFVNFGGVTGSFLWMCNGFDTPQIWDGTTLAAAVITGTGFLPADMIHCCVYRQRIWTVIKDSTKAVYLDTNAIQGAGTVFDVGQNFVNGGYLEAIGAWSTDTVNGPNEFIAFISSQGDVATYLITDPTQASGISFIGRSEVGQPIGRRCVSKVGADLAVISLDGVLPLSKTLTYDKAALIGQSITKNIRQAVVAATRAGKDLFGWELTSYARNTMAILNVPISENEQQEQYVMNTITGAWGRFQGQNANCWEVFLDDPYFGGNDGVVRLADESGGDENQTLSADMQCAFNYYGSRGQLKNWTTIRPNITIDVTFPTQPNIGLNIDFGTDGELDPITFGTGQTLPLWNQALWNQAIWPGVTSATNWAALPGLGYCASIRMTVDIPWDESLITPSQLQINTFDTLYYDGAFI